MIYDIPVIYNKRFRGVLADAIDQYDTPIERCQDSRLPLSKPVVGNLQVSGQTLYSKSRLILPDYVYVL